MFDIEGTTEYVVIGKAGCTWCTAVVELLEYMGPTFEYHDASEDEEAMEFLKDNNFKTVPQVFHLGDSVGGYEDTVRFLKNNHV